MTLRHFYKITLLSLGVVGIFLGVLLIILNNPTRYLLGIEMFIIPVAIAIRVTLDRMKESEPGKQNGA